MATRTTRMTRNIAVFPVLPVVMSMATRMTRNIADFPVVTFKNQRSSV
jgi:hypothetical protein